MRCAPKRIPYDPHASLADRIAQSIAKSLENLQTDHLDFLILHSPLPTVRETLAAWQEFEAFVDAGTVRQLGISNIDEAGLEQLHRLARIKPAVVQNRFHAETGYDRELRSFCRHHEVIYQSFWTLTANPQALVQPAIVEAAASHRRTAAQILFRYLTGIGVVPLSGTKSDTHMREDLAIFDFELDAGQRRGIGTLFGE